MSNRQVKHLKPGHKISLTIENIDKQPDGSIKLWFLQGGNAVIDKDAWITILARPL